MQKKKKIGSEGGNEAKSNVIVLEAEGGSMWEVSVRWEDIGESELNFRGSGICVR